MNSISQNCPRLTASEHPIGLGGEDEVALGQAIDLVSPDGQPDFPPGQIDVGVVALLLSEVADPIGEVERFAEVLEAELLLEVVLFHHPPVVAQSGQQVIELRSPEGRRPTLARNALKHGQVTHSAPSSVALGPGVKGGKPVARSSRRLLRATRRFSRSTAFSAFTSRRCRFPALSGI